MIRKREYSEIALVMEYVLSLAMITFSPDSNWITAFFVLTKFVLWPLYVCDKYKLRFSLAKSFWR